MPLAMDALEAAAADGESWRGMAWGEGHTGSARTSVANSSQTCAWAAAARHKRCCTTRRSRGTKETGARRRPAAEVRALRDLLHREEHPSGRPSARLVTQTAVARAVGAGAVSGPHRTRRLPLATRRWSLPRPRQVASVGRWRGGRLRRRGCWQRLGVVGGRRRADGGTLGRCGFPEGGVTGDTRYSRAADAQSWRRLGCHGGGRRGGVGQTASDKCTSRRSIVMNLNLGGRSGNGISTSPPLLVAFRSREWRHLTGSRLLAAIGPTGVHVPRLRRFYSGRGGPRTSVSVSPLHS